MVKHVNSGSCEKCYQIIYQYPNPTPHPDLIAFFEHVVTLNKDCHVAYLGRGKAEQEQFFDKKTSLAHFGQSPHNYNLAVDFFRLTLTGADWNIGWFTQISKELTKFPTLSWGGSWIKFKDYPHFELTNWKELVKDGKVQPVEPTSTTP